MDLKITLCNTVKSGMGAGIGGSMFKLASGLRAAGVNVEEYYPTPRLSLAISDLFYGLGKINRPWAVHCYNEMIWNTPNAFRTYAGVIRTIHRVYEEEKGWAMKNKLFFNAYFGLHLALETQCIKNNICVCESQVIKRQLHNEYGIENKNINLIPIGIDTKMYRSGKSSSTKYNIPEKDFVVSWVGHPEFNKGMKYLLETANELKDQNVTFILRSSPIMPSHRLYRNWFEVKEKVIFMPRFDNINDFYNLSDAFYMSSTTEAFCIALAEAMACEKPALVFEGVGIADEVVFDNQSGFRLSYKDSGAVAQKILYLRDHPEKAKAMGIAGRNNIKASYSPQQMINGHIQMYKRWTPT